MRRLAAVAILALAGCQQAPDLAVSNAWVRLNAVPGRPAAAYFTLSARQAATLTGVSTPAAARAELHEMRKAGPAMTMAALPRVPVPAGGTVAFAPGGKHVMLFDVTPEVKPGGSTTLTLTFADGKTVTAIAPVKGAGDAAPTS